MHRVAAADVVLAERVTVTAGRITKTVHQTRCAKCGEIVQMRRHDRPGLPARHIWTHVSKEAA